MASRMSSPSIPVVPLRFLPCCVEQSPIQRNTSCAMMRPSPDCKSRSRGQIKEGYVGMKSCRFLFILIVFLCAPYWRTPAAVQNETTLVSEARHSPQQPPAGIPVTIYLKLRSAAASVALEYQTVDPGEYIAIKDAKYAAAWVS